MLHDIVIQLHSRSARGIFCDATMFFMPVLRSIQRPTGIHGLGDRCRPVVKEHLLNRYLAGQLLVEFQIALQFSESEAGWFERKDPPIPSHAFGQGQSMPAHIAPNVSYNIS